MGETTAWEIRKLIWWYLWWKRWAFWIGPYYVAKSYDGVFWQRNPYCDDEGSPHEIRWGHL